MYFCFIDYAKAFYCVDHNKLRKILKEMDIPDHLTCLLRNLYAAQEATVRTGHGTMNWFKLGKEYISAVFAFFFLNSPVCFPSLYNNIASMIRKKKVFLKK